MNVMSSPEQATDDVSRTVTAIREALTEQMVERVATTGSNAFELLDRLNDERTNNAVHHLIDRLTELHQVGALDTMCDLVLALHGTRAALTDSMIERLFSFVETIVNTVGHDDVCNLVDATCNAMMEAASESANKPARGGLFGTISMLSKPETQRSLQFLMTFAEKLSRPKGC